MAKVCLILSSSGVDLKTVAAMAELAASRGSKEGAALIFTFAKGWRSFVWAITTKPSGGPVSQLKSPIPQPKAGAAAVLAMSEFKLDQLENARSAALRLQ